MWSQVFSCLEARVYRIIPRSVRIRMLNRQMRRMDQDASLVLGPPQEQPEEVQAWALELSQESMELN